MAVDYERLFNGAANKSLFNQNETRKYIDPDMHSALRQLRQTLKDEYEPNKVLAQTQFRAVALRQLTDIVINNRRQIRVIARIPEIHSFLPIPTDENDFKSIAMYPTFVGDVGAATPQRITRGQHVIVTFGNMTNFSDPRLLEILDLGADPIVPVPSTNPRPATGPRGPRVSNFAPGGGGVRTPQIPPPVVPPRPVLLASRKAVRVNKNEKIRVIGIQKKKRTRPPNQIAIHEAGGSSPDGTATTFQARGVGTHFLVAPDGKITGYILDPKDDVVAEGLADPKAPAWKYGSSMPLESFIEGAKKYFTHHIAAFDFNKNSIAIEICHAETPKFAQPGTWASKLNPSISNVANWIVDAPWIPTIISSRNTWVEGCKDVYQPRPPSTGPCESNDDCAAGYDCLPTSGAWPEFPDVQQKKCFDMTANPSGVDGHVYGGDPALGPALESGCTGRRIYVPPPLDCLEAAWKLIYAIGQQADILLDFPHVSENKYFFRKVPAKIWSTNSLATKPGVFAHGHVRSQTHRDGYFPTLYFVLRERGFEPSVAYTKTMVLARSAGSSKTVDLPLHAGAPPSDPGGIDTITNGWNFTNKLHRQCYKPVIVDCRKAEGSKLTQCNKLKEAGMCATRRRWKGRGIDMGTGLSKNVQQALLRPLGTETTRQNLGGDPTPIPKGRCVNSTSFSDVPTATPMVTKGCCSSLSKTAQSRKCKKLCYVDFRKHPAVYTYTAANGKCEGAPEWVLAGFDADDGGGSLNLPDGQVAV